MPTRPKTKMNVHKKKQQNEREKTQLEIIKEKEEEVEYLRTSCEKEKKKRCLFQKRFYFMIPLSLLKKQRIHLFRRWGFLNSGKLNDREFELGFFASHKRYRNITELFTKHKERIFLLCFPAYLFGCRWAVKVKRTLNHWVSRT